jgi:ATP-dependent Clp protease adaptor protein ClpS
MSQHPEHKHDDDLAVQEAKPKIKRPPLFKVFLLNDDFTPMEFVVEILKVFFGMDEEKATQGPSGQRLFPAEPAPAALRHGRSLS